MMERGLYPPKYPIGNEGIPHPYKTFGVIPKVLY